MVYLFLADGFEEIEGLTVVDLLRRAQIETKTVSIMKRTQIHGAHGIDVEADLLIEDVKDVPAMAVLPGGMPGTIHLKEHAMLRDLLVDWEKTDCYITAICAAPTVLGDLGLLEGKSATCYPGMEDGLLGAKKLTDPVVQDGKIITSRGMGTAIEFALCLIANLKDAATADALAKGIVYER